MEYSEKKIPSRDGLLLFMRLWQPKQEPLAVINMVHGLGEHGGRYDPWAKRFTSEDIAFASIDYRGHGHAEGKRGHASSHEVLLDDIEAFLHETKQRYPEIPHILYGHSLGGNLVLAYISRRKHTLNGCIATSPWLKLASEPPLWKTTAARLLLPVAQSMTISNGLNPYELSHNSDVARAYLHDPLVHDKISLRLYFDTQKEGHFILQKGLPVNTPVLIAHGSGDKITSHIASQELCTHCGKNLTFRLFKDMYHELHHESCAPELFALIKNWIIDNCVSLTDFPSGHGYF